ncbi:MAG: signal peptidase I [Planctomycetia bacterium]
MKGAGDQALAAALEARLAQGPADVLDLLEAARSALGPALRGQEGALHPLLLELEAAGRVQAGGAGARGLCRYARAGDGLPAAVPGAGLPPVPRAAVERAVARVRTPALRARVAADVEAHLAALEAQGAVREAGTLGTLRAQLERASRGRPAVHLAQGASGRLLRFLLHEGPWIVGAALLYAVLHVWVLQVFVIPSASMLPTLQLGDRLVVSKLGGQRLPARWDIVTYQRPGQDGPRTTYVKRVVGLPGEELALWHGDLYVDGRLLRKPAALSALLRARVGRWDFTRGTPAGWGLAREEGGTREAWVRPGDRLWAPGHDPSRRFELQDLYVDLDASLPEPGAWARLRLARGATRPGAVSFLLDLDGAGHAVLRRQDAAGEAVLAELRGATGTGSVRLSLALVDGVLQARAGALRVEREVEVPAEAADFGFVLAGGARPLALAVDRDQHWGAEGALAVPRDGRALGPREAAHRVGEAAVFCLGDNTADSRDSRFQEVGDVPLAQLVGPVVWRLWPPGRFGPPEQPPGDGRD